MESVLDSTKKTLGIEANYPHFDPEIITFINGAFSTLHQLGVGPKEPFYITGKTEEWHAFTEDDAAINSVKTYVYAKVRLVFDPPSTSFGITGLENLCSELEWRLNVASERG